MLEENLRINEPGLNVLPPGVERYVINGGGLTGVQIFPDDESFWSRVKSRAENLLVDEERKSLRGSPAKTKTLSTART